VEVWERGKKVVLYHRRLRQSFVLALLMYMSLGCTASPRLRFQADDHYQLALSYWENGSYPLAEQEIRKALDLRPNAPRYFELLALIYQKQGRLSLAEEAYRMALQQHDVPPSVLVNYSTLLLLRERLDEVIVLVQRALQDPGYEKPVIAYTNLGLAYLKKGDLRQAARQFHTALKYQPDLPEVHHNLGLVYARLEERDKAVREFRAAIRFRPSYVEAYAGLGKVLLEMGRAKEARFAFERVIALGKTLLEAGRTDEARFAFEQVVALVPDSDMAVASRKQLELLTP
jgi:Tfp pilus assembly protein PilF